MTERRSWAGAGALLVGAALVWVVYTLYPATPGPGPLLQAAQQRGVLAVALRSYPRPTLARTPLQPAPDLLDAQLGAYLGAELGVPVRWVPASEAEVVINLPAPGRPATGLAGAPDGGILALRGDASENLSGQAVCLAAGSPWRAALEQQGARVQAYPSSLRASVAFMAGECRYYAEARNALVGLQQLPQWRFYRLLPQVLSSPVDAQLALAGPDPASQAWLKAALARYRRGGQQASAWALHADELLGDSLKLADGLVCH